MDVDLELYRHEVRVSHDPLIRLSAIDLHPERPRRTFLFIHGYGGFAKQWYPQIQEFSLSNRVIALDLRGHGQSDRPNSDYTMAEIQGDLETALEVLGVEGQFVLVGHSFGGAVAAEFAAAHPEKIEKLILTATSGEFRLNPLYRILLRLPYSFHRAVGPFLRRWLGAPPTVLKRWFHNTLADWNGWSLFRDLRVPTLVIRGHRDRVFARTFFEEVARAIPDSEEVNVGASGHMVMLERRQAVNRAIRRFLDETPSSWHETGATRQSLLQQERPWLAHYEPGVPFTISLPNIPLHHLLRSAVRRFPLRPALVFEGKRLTYRRLNHEANRFANALRSLGVDKGERVMLLMPNLPQLVTAFYGTLKAGAVAVFSFPLNENDELLRQLQDSGAKVLVTLDRFRDLARQALESTSLEHVILTSPASYLPTLKQLGLRLSGEARPGRRAIEGQEGRTHRFNRLLYAHSRKSPEVAVSPGDLAAIQYTGGTTDLPRGVMLSHHNLVANALQTRHWMPEAKEGQEVFLCVIPFSHSYGLTAALNVPVAIGATLILKPQFETRDTLKAIKRYKPSIFPGVPRMYVAISDFPGVRRYGVASIQACICGSAPLPVEVQESFEKLTRGRLVEGYGLTEASPVTHANPLQGLRKIGTIGIPLPSTEARIVSLANPKKEMPVGQIGELAVRGPQVMLGYWNDEKATRKVLQPNGWLLTGDVVVQDDQGYFRLIARKADMWYPSKPGEPAFPRDVEEVLFEVPQVKEAAVVAIAGQPIAFVIAKDQRPTADSLIAYCKRRLPPELVPRLVVFLDDFPRTFIGKVLRRELARHYDQNYQG